MARIRWEMKTEAVHLTVDLPSGLYGDPVVINVRKADGTTFGPLYLGATEGGDERSSCLDRAAEIVRAS